MPSRFTVDIPSGLRVAWNMLRHGESWRERCRTWVTDHRRRERFALTDDEDLLLDVLSENMDAVAKDARISLLKLGRFWTPQKIDAAKDRVLAAISDNRHGDSIEWDWLKAMPPDQWKAWLREIVEGDGREVSSVRAR